MTADLSTSSADEDDESGSLPNDDVPMNDTSDASTTWGCETAGSTNQGRYFSLLILLTVLGDVDDAHLNAEVVTLALNHLSELPAT